MSTTESEFSGEAEIIAREQAPRALLAARAYELAEIERKSSREVAEFLNAEAPERGWPRVSATTAWRLVNEGREAAAYAGLLDLAELRLGRSRRLDLYTTMLVEEFRAGGGKALEYVPLLLKIEDNRARLEGTDAVTRVAVSHPDGPVPDADTVAAVRAVQRAAHADEQDT